MSDVKMVGKEPSRHPKMAIVFQSSCPKCGEPILIKTDVVSTSLEISIGTKHAIPTSPSLVESTFKGRQVA